MVSAKSRLTAVSLQKLVFAQCSSLKKKKHFDIRSRLTLLTTDYNLCFMDEESEAWRSKSQSSGGMGGPAPRHHRIPPSSAPGPPGATGAGAEGGACPQGSRSVPVKPPGSPGPAAAPAWTVQLCEPSCLQAEETVREERSARASAPRGTPTLRSRLPAALGPCAVALAPQAAGLAERTAEM